MKAAIDDEAAPAAAAAVEGMLRAGAYRDPYQGPW
jgi:hypothetical protein